MRPCTLVAGTADGVRVLSINEFGRGSVTASGVHGNAVRGIAVDPDAPGRMYVAAGLRGSGLQLTLDGGRTFQALGFEDRWVWDVVLDPSNPSRVLAGTEPPMLYESLDGGHTWRALSGIDHVSSRPNWTFFHAPYHAGHLHGIAITPERPRRIIVGVEHGGLLVSRDGGDSWNDVMPGADMHRVVISPDDPDRIWAGAGNGLFLSTDGGDSWSQVNDLRGRYIHGIVIDPDDPRRMFVYVDSQRCPVYRSADGGESWDAAGDGLPSSKPADPIRLHPEDRAILFYAGDADGESRLYLSEDDGDDWHDTGVRLPKVWRLATVPAAGS